MHRIARRPVALTALALLALVLAAVPARAQLTVYTNATTFTNDTGALVVADFQSRSFGANASFALGGITFSSPLNNLYIIDGSVTNTHPTPTSKGLTGNGEDTIDMTLPSGTRAVGWVTITNRFAPPVVTVYGPGNVVIGTHTLTQATNTYGFIGFLCISDIAKVRWAAVGGGTENTMIDDVRVTSLPTPASAASWGRIKSLYR